jgi:hypothetical protein
MPFEAAEPGPAVGGGQAIVVTGPPGTYAEAGLAAEASRLSPGGDR